MGLVCGSFAFGSQNLRQANTFIFFLFVFGGVLFCAGFALSIYGFQSCQSDNFSSCNMTYKVLGPSLAVIGLASLLMARSTARLERRRGELSGDQTDPGSLFLCGESRQFVQYLTLGILFVTFGILISIPGVLIPECKKVSQHGNGIDITSKNCGSSLSLQIMGPVIVLIGLCLFVGAHINKKYNVNDTSDVDEEPQIPRNGPFCITVGDEVILFPPPPPQYFDDVTSASICHEDSTVPLNESPPSYRSIFNIRCIRVKYL
ncbi:transmembrane protein 171-like [Spea bombifrons]|uniref:transmembrane protein 171-like n=1 Tax=Spea bombifrons TaxID=233779 RepID=UPI00234A0527|nr:transmembrane protein 171-like [Spea bombifrons]